MKGKVLHVRAANETEALAKVFAEYGKEAVIGEIRQVRKRGIAGLAGGKETEVSVRIKPQVVSSEGEIEKFRTLVNRIGQSIRAEQNEGYYKQWGAVLAKFDIEGSLAGKLLSEVRDKPCDPETFARTIAMAIPIKQQVPRVMALVGPPGAGKTTTVAKLAGIHSCQLGKKVAIITLDTTRIGAVEQLRIYARIMGVPLSVVSSPGEFKEALTRYDNRDHVYIDTTGRPPSNLLYMSELKTFLEESSAIEVALVVSATTKLNDLLLASKGYSKLTPSSLIVTKVDETASLGSIITFIHQSSLPLIYIGTGQGVPQNIEFANSKVVSDWVSSGLNSTSGSKGGTSIGWQTG